jgi:hypothetical protein
MKPKDVLNVDKLRALSKGADHPGITGTFGQDSEMPTGRGEASNDE